MLDRAATGGPDSDAAEGGGWRPSASNGDAFDAGQAGLQKGHPLDHAGDHPLGFAVGHPPGLAELLAQADGYGRDGDGLGTQGDALSGENGGARRTPRVRDEARLHFGIGHALIVILILVAALCASLTLLIQQARNYAAFERQSWTLANSWESPSQTEMHPDPGTTPSDTGSPSEEPSADSSTQPSDEAPAAPSVEASHTSALIDLNTASSADLTTIKGIGPVTAEKIVAYRSTIGRFHSVDQLLDVQGIGVKTLEKLRPHLTVQ
ncbi:MAG: helix-hairpin-helix domain-containing protein [Bifidobacterium psychraerophilum]|uniref:ComEA family DNA-binding protein n=1 Tax=Bifidobacterium psychraerophilum TaxID=218140 RepID=UPI0039E987A6